MVSLEPGSPISTRRTSSDACCPPGLIRIGLFGSVTSVMFALLENAVGLGVPATVRALIALLFTWYVLPSWLRTMIVIFPCGFVPLLLYLTLKPKLVFAPASGSTMPFAELSPAGAVLVR